MGLWNWTEKTREDGSCLSEEIQYRNEVTSESDSVTECGRKSRTIPCNNYRLHSRIALLAGFNCFYMSTIYEYILIISQSVHCASEEFYLVKNCM